MDHAKGIVPIQSQLPPLLSKLQQKLKSKYKKETVQLPGSKPKSSDYESEEVLLDDIFVKLNILSKSQLDQRAGHEAAQGSVSEMERMAHAFSRGSGRMKPMQLGQVLRLASKKRCRLLKKLGVRILALAGGGVGKTTSFLKKGALEWANGNIWTNIDLLFALPLRQPSVHLAKDLEELLDLKDHGFHRQTDREEICDYIDKNLGRVCIILDGLDEIHLSQCSDFVLKLIQGVSVDGVRLIVTSRPSIPVLQLAKKHPFNERIEVLGFSQEDMAQYVGKVLKPDDAKEVMKQVQANPTLAGLMQIPLNAANICMLYRSGIKTLPTSMPSIVSAVIHQAIQQNEEKKLEAMYADEDPSKLDPMLLDSVKELAAFAFRTLVDRVLVFEKRHFQEHRLSKDALSLGLLVACDYNSPDSQPQFVFYHLCMHEGLAARHAAAFLTCADDIIWLVDTLGGLAGHLNTFWRFLAAELDCASVDNMVRALLSIPKIGLDSTDKPEEEASSGSGAEIPIFLGTSYAEMCALADRLSSQIDISSAERLAEQLLEGVVSGSGTVAVRATMQQGRPLTGAEFLRELLFFWKSRVPRASRHMLYCAVAAFDKAMAGKCFPALACRITHNSNSQPREIVDHQTEDAKQLLLLSCHCYGEFCVSNDNFPILKSLYLALEKFTELNLFGCVLTPSDCRAVGLVLQHYGSVLSAVNLAFCKIGDIGYTEISEGLGLCHCLETLYLTGNDLTDKHANHIAMVIGNNSATLTTAMAVYNEFSSFGNATVHSSTHLCQQLKVTGVGGSDCTDSSLNITTLCMILSDCPLVNAVTITECALEVEDIVRLATALSGHECHHLALDDIGLNEEYGPAVNLLLYEQKDNLRIISLQKNDVSLEFLFEICDVLRQCSNLQALYFTGAKLSSTSLSVLASLLPFWPGLTQLSLNNNDFTNADETYEFFAHAVQACTDLKLLSMPDRGFVHPDFAAALDTIDGDVLEVEFEDDPLLHDQHGDAKDSKELLAEEDDGEESDDDLVAIEVL